MIDVKECTFESVGDSLASIIKVKLTQTSVAQGSSVDWRVLPGYSAMECQSAATYSWCDTHSTHGKTEILYQYCQKVHS